MLEEVQRLTGGARGRIPDPSRARRLSSRLLQGIDAVPPDRAGRIWWWRDPGQLAGEAFAQLAGRFDPGDPPCFLMSYEHGRGGPPPVWRRRRSTAVRGHLHDHGIDVRAH